MLWSEEDILQNGRFVLDIPDNLEVCNYSLLVQLIDSVGDSVITLSIIKDFLIVNESPVDITPAEPPKAPDLYLIQEGNYVDGELLYANTDSFTVYNSNNVLLDIIMK